MLDLAYGTRGGSPETAGGSQFFMWARNMVVDAYYTSPVGVKDIGYMGNTAMSSFSVPQEAADYALKRSPFGSRREQRQRKPRYSDERQIRHGPRRCDTSAAENNLFEIGRRR